MGLDQYAYYCDTKLLDGLSVGFEKLIENIDKTQFCYWRKHPDLQGWMENLYHSKGGQEEFNCVGVRLEKDDLDNLEKAIRHSELPKTTGFFFGPSRNTFDQDEYDLNFIRQARDLISCGFAVFYSSWW